MVDMSETCRVLYQINLKNSASRWLSNKNTSQCTVLWMSKSTETFHWCYLYILARNLELNVAKLYMPQHTLLREQYVTAMKTSNNKTSEMHVVLFLSNFNQNWNVSTNFSENPSINLRICLVVVPQLMQMDDS